MRIIVTSHDHDLCFLDCTTVQPGRAQGALGGGEFLAIGCGRGEDGRGVPGLPHLAQAVWSPRLGCAIERIKPDHPSKKGRHERMHLTLKLGMAKPAARTSRHTRPSICGFRSALPALVTALPWSAKSRLSLPRQSRHRDRLRPHLLQLLENQSQSGVHWPDHRQILAGRQDLHLRIVESSAISAAKALGKADAFSHLTQRRKLAQY